MYTFKKSISPAAVLSALVILLLTGSCIENDLPYPWVQATFTKFVVERTDADGHDLLSSATEIDSVGRTVTIHLSEWADIENVKLVDWQLNDGSTLVSPATMPELLDLSEPMTLTLGLYDRTFEWTVEAVQDIRRYFNVASQIGASEIDVKARTIKALVPESLPLDAVTVTSIKLGGEGSVMTPDLNGRQVDFTSPVTVSVSEFGETEEWTITVEQTQSTVAMTRVDAWTNVAWLYAHAEQGKQNVFEYRLATADEWTEVPAQWVTVNGGSISACLRHLQPTTTYVARAKSDDEVSAELTFTTEAAVQLPNSDFTQWWLNGKVWNPWAEGGEPFWDTGNRGATTLGNSNSVPIENPNSDTGYQGAKLETKFVGVSMLGKLAAGNLFAGVFVRVDGTNGVLEFGRPFTQRPTAVKARIKYITRPITHASKSNPDFTYMIGQPDTCIVWCSLGDWDQAVEIRTRPSDRKLFDRNEPQVIAYGELTLSDTVEEFADYVFKLNYNATDRVPKYLLLTASASKYGDYFTGATGATLYIESYELLYDYD